MNVLAALRTCAARIHYAWLRRKDIQRLARKYGSLQIDADDFGLESPEHMPNLIRRLQFELRIRPEPMDEKTQHAWANDKLRKENTKLRHDLKNFEATHRDMLKDHAEESVLIERYRPFLRIIDAIIERAEDRGGV